MTISDLVFVLLVFGTLVVAVMAGIALLRRRYRRAGRMAMGCAGVWVVYLAAGFVMAVASPQRVVARGDERCFDEMCFAVTGVQRQGDRLEVKVRVANRARARMQSEGGAVGWLLAKGGERFWPVAQDGGLDVRLAAGESKGVQLVFRVPAGARGLGLVVDHGYRFNPGRIIFGEEAHWLHRPTVLEVGE